jgi:hypothetical protein
LQRRVGAVGDEARRAGDAKFAAIPDKAPVRHGAELDGGVRGDRVRRAGLAMVAQVAG